MFSRDSTESKPSVSFRYRWTQGCSRKSAGRGCCLGMAAALGVSGRGATVGAETGDAAGLVEGRPTTLATVAWP